MIPFILRRLLWSIPLLGVVSILSFVLTSFSPGSVAATMLSTGATPEAVQDLNNRLGLNLPLYEQYWNWLSGILFHASLGNSLLSNAPVTALLMDRLPVTLSLTFLTLAFCSLLGVTLGFVSAVRGGVLARFVDSFSLIAMSLPSFWLGAVFISIFAVTLRWLPASGFVPFSVSPGLWLSSLVLPVLVISTTGVANIALNTRSEVLAAFSHDYVRGLRANGIPNRHILLKHVFKNAAAPVVTVIGLLFVGLLGGTVVIESVFGLAGLGSLAVTATNQADLPVIQGIVVLFTLIVLFVYLAVDIVYAYLNPKARIA